MQLLKLTFPIFIAFFISCQNDDFNNLISTDTLRLVVVSGDNQSAPADHYLSEPVVVKASLQTGEGFAGKELTITVLSGGGTVDRLVDTTDTQGSITINWKLGLEVGTQTLKVAGAGLDDLLISATALSLPGTLELLSGQGQAGYPGDTLAVPLVVAIRDQERRPISGRRVVTRVPSGYGRLVPASGITDDQGKMVFQWIVGEMPGQHSVEILAGTAENLRVTAEVRSAPQDMEIVVFENAVIEYATGNQTISTEVQFPEDQYKIITAELILNSPCESCSESDCDPWDRFGSIRLEDTDMEGEFPPLELIKFITPFGNSRVYTVDLSAYGSLLRGKKTIKASISTFLGKWFITLRIRFQRATLNPRIIAAVPLFFDSRIWPDESDTLMTVEVPENSRVELAYRPTGHNSKGRGCDEFCKKVHEIYLDGVLVQQVVPWREDCEDFLPLNRCGNPGSVRASRAGWCPGALITPQLIDLGLLSAGTHTIRLRILDINPNGGYWNASMDLRIYR